MRVLEKTKCSGCGVVYTAGHKCDAGKLARFDLIPVGPLWALAELFGTGARKYNPRNWEAGMDWSRGFGAMMRHAWKFWWGESYDPVDGQHHLASAAWYCFALMEWEKTHPELDDRSKGVKK